MLEITSKNIEGKKEKMKTVRIKKTVASLYNKKRDAQKAHSYDISCLNFETNCLNIDEKKEPVVNFLATSSKDNKNKYILTHDSTLRNGGAVCQ